MQYKILKFLSRLICLLPYGAVLKLGGFLGGVYYRLAGRQKRRAKAQIMESLRLADGEAEKIVRGLFANMGKNFLEIMYMPNLNPSSIKKYVTTHNMEYLRAAVRQGRGVVILTAHVGNWEWLGAALSLSGLPVTTLVKPQPNEQHTRILNEYRQMVGMEVFASGTTELVAAARALKKGKILGFLADQDAGTTGAFVPFLGKPASTPLGPAVFAKRFHAPIIPAYILRDADGRHHVHVFPQIEYRDTGDEERDLYDVTVRMTALLEDVIRRHPTEWLWFQKRWNTSLAQARDRAMKPPGKGRAES